MREINLLCRLGVGSLVNLEKACQGAYTQGCKAEALHFGDSMEKSLRATGSMNGTELKPEAWAGVRVGEL